MDDYAVHLADHGIRVLGHVRLIILIGTPYMALFVLSEHRAAFFPLRPAQFPPQVYVPCSQNPCIYVGIDRVVRYQEFIPVLFADSRDRLPLLNQR